MLSQQETAGGPARLAGPAGHFPTGSLSILLKRGPLRWWNPTIWVQIPPVGLTWL